MDERIELPPEQMRAFGYKVIDLLVDHHAQLQEQAVGRRAAREILEAALREPVPEEGADPLQLLERLERDVFANMVHVDHPRFFAFVPAPGNFVSAMADALASGFNVFTGTWLAGSGPAQVELVVVDWLRQICGLPDSAGGLFVSGGSVANLTALAAARHVVLKDEVDGAVVYTSDQTHSSVKRALKVLGFAPAQVRTITADEHYQLPVETLRTEIAADRAEGRRPFCVIANAGTTNTGAVDPLRELAALCRQEGMWLHADGAYGAPAVLTEDGKRTLEGMEAVDSLALDPHKWLFQSFETGCVLVRDRSHLLETFQVMPEYLRDTMGVPGEVNFGNYGIQLTRSFRALKLWMSLQTFGLAAYRRAIARGIRLAKVAEEALHDSGTWEIVTPAKLAVVTFRYRNGALSDAEVDALHGAMVEAMMVDGYALSTSTVLRGRPVLRFCTINPRTEEEEIRETVRRMSEMAERLAARR